MTKSQRFKVGSKFIERGGAFRVYKIEREKINGSTEIIIHYKPFFKDSTNGAIVCSIPECNMDDDMRNPVSKHKIRKLVHSLSVQSKKDSLDALDAKSILNLNDIQKTVSVLKIYWRDKKKEGDSFTKTKKDILNAAIDRSVEEVALVLGMSLDKAKDKILLALGN